MGCTPKKCPQTIPPGERPHRLRWERQSAVDDGQGGQGVSWLLMGNPWAKAEQLSAAEVFQRGGVTSESTVRFSLNWTPALAAIRPSDRFIFREREYNIQTVDNVDFSDTVLEVVATTGVVQ